MSKPLNKIFKEAMKAIPVSGYSCRALTRSGATLSQKNKYRGMFGFEPPYNTIDPFVKAIEQHAGLPYLKKANDFRVLLLGFAHAAWEDFREEDI